MEIRIYIHRNFETFLDYIVNIYQGDHQLDILVSLVKKWNKVLLNPTRSSLDLELDADFDIDGGLTIIANGFL